MTTYRLSYQDRQFELRQARIASRHISQWYALELKPADDFWPDDYTVEVPGTVARTATESLAALKSHIHQEVSMA